MWKTSKKIKKSRASNDQNIHYEENWLNTRIYLAQTLNPFPDRLPRTFKLQLSIFLFRSILRIHTKLDLDLFLNPQKKKFGFYLQYDDYESRDETHIESNPFRKKLSNSKMIFNRKPIKFSFESNIPKIGKELEAQRGFFSAFTAVSPQLERRLKY